jgi:hypothetical protein
MTLFSIEGKLSVSLERKKNTSMMSLLIQITAIVAAVFIGAGCGCMLAEMGLFRWLPDAPSRYLQKLKSGLKDEIVELPFPMQTVISAPMHCYRKMTHRKDQYVCPVCLCAAICSDEPQSLEPERKHAPRLYAYTCISGHSYWLRFDADVWGYYRREINDAYVLIH